MVLVEKLIGELDKDIESYMNMSELDSSPDKLEPVCVNDVVCQYMIKCSAVKTLNKMSSLVVNSKQPLHFYFSRCSAVKVLVDVLIDEYVLGQCRCILTSSDCAPSSSS